MKKIKGISKSSMRTARDMKKLKFEYPGNDTDTNKSVSASRIVIGLIVGLFGALLLTGFDIKSSLVFTITVCVICGALYIVYVAFADLPNDTPYY